MKCYLILLIMCLSSFALMSQPYYISKRRAFECPDTAKYASIAFVNYIQNQQFDSAQFVLKKWTQKCGMNEPLLRAHFIFAIATNMPIESLINEQSMRLIDDYQHRGEMIKYRSYNQNYSNEWSYGYIPIGMAFDTFSVNYFNEIRWREKDNSLKFLLSNVYSNQGISLYTMLQQNEYKETLLAKEYYKLVYKYMQKPDFNIALLAGAWVPSGGIARLGVHPDIGVQLGSKFRKVNLDFTVMFKFLPSKNSYYARRVSSNNATVVTNKFFGGYIGVDFGYDVWKRKKMELQALFGTGFDGFDALDQDTTKGLGSERTMTYNINWGVGYRYYISNSTYVGMRAKYNVVDYALNEVVSFNGHPITITFCVGGLSNKNKRHGLEYLKYKWNRIP